MKITLITQYYKPEMGAPQNRLYEMCSELKKLGADISIITGMPNYPTGKVFNEYKGKFSTIEVLDDIEIKRYWLYASNTSFSSYLEYDFFLNDGILRFTLSEKA